MEASSAEIRPDVPRGLGWTALLASAARDSERSQDHPLVLDPWAQLFSEPAAPHFGGQLSAVAAENGQPRISLWEFLDSYIVARTLLIDHEVTRAAAEGYQQIVLLAAGLDARAARLDLTLPAQVPVFEVDREALLAFKFAVLEQHDADVTRHVPVVADLDDDGVSAMQEVGFDPGHKTCWVAEGLLYYLPESSLRALIETIKSTSGTRGRLVTEHYTRVLEAEDFDTADREIMRKVKPMLQSSSAGLGPEAWSREFGLEPLVSGDAGTDLKDLGRPVPPVLSKRARSPFTAWYVAAQTG